MPKIRSNFVTAFNHSIRDKDQGEQDSLWEQISNPIIENIPGKPEKLVTFLYRMQPDESDRTREAGGLTVVSSPKGCHC